MKRAPALLGLLLAAGLAGVAGIAAGEAPRAAAETRRLVSGEVLVRLAERPGGGPAEGVGTGVIDAPPERVFAALTDFAHYQEWVPFVTRSDARPQADGAVLSAQWLELPALLGKRHYQIRAVSRVEMGKGGKVFVIRWTYVTGSGNVVDQRGSWTVTSFGEGRAIATCHLLTDPGDAPAWAMNRATAKTLPWIFQGLRQQILRDRYLR